MTRNAHPDPRKMGTHRISLHWGGLERQYLLHPPAPTTAPAAEAEPGPPDGGAPSLWLLLYGFFQGSVPKWCAGTPYL